MKQFLCVVSLAALLCYASSCKRADKAADEKGAEPAIIVDTAISADGVPISYEVRGRGEPALVFIHGWCCDRSYWKEQLPHFAKKYEVVAIDLAGHGGSGLNRKKWTMEAFGKDVVAVVNKLSLEQVILVGHSLGGPVILEAGSMMPKCVIGLIGVDTLDDFEGKYSQEFINNFFAGIRGNFVEYTKNFVRPMFTPNSNPMLIERIVTDMSSAPPEAGIGALEAFFNFVNNDMTQVLRELKMPITCINSDRNPPNIKTNQRYAPSFKAKIMSGVGHFVMLEDPETFNRLLDETIQEFVQMTESR